MPSVSNIAVGALVAGSAASKARHGMNESIARLSTGMTIYVWRRCSGSISC